MSKKSIECAVPVDLQDVDLEYMALINLRDRYVRLPFCYKRAKRASIEAMKLTDKFWMEIRELYPELTGKSLLLNRSKQVIEIIKD